MMMMMNQQNQKLKEWRSSISLFGHRQQVLPEAAAQEPSSSNSDGENRRHQDVDVDGNVDVDVEAIVVDLERNDNQNQTAETRDDDDNYKKNSGNAAVVPVSSSFQKNNKEETTKIKPYQQPPPHKKWMMLVGCFVLLLLLLIAAIIVVAVVIGSKNIDTHTHQGTTAEGENDDENATINQPSSTQYSSIPPEEEEEESSNSVSPHLRDNTFCNQACPIQFGSAIEIDDDFDTIPEEMYFNIVSCEQIIDEQEIVAQEFATTTESSHHHVRFGPAYYFVYHHLGPDYMSIRAGVTISSKNNNNETITNDDNDGFPVRVHESCSNDDATTSSSSSMDSCLDNARYNNIDNSVEWQAMEGREYILQVQYGSSLILWTNSRIENAFLIEPDTDSTEDRVPSVGIVVYGTTTTNNNEEQADNMIMMPACGDASNQTTIGVWYKLQAIPDRPSMTATTCGLTTNFDTQISIFSISSTNSNNDDSSLLTCVAGNNDVNENMASSTLCDEKKSAVSWSSSNEDSSPSSENEEYFYILVHGFSSSEDDTDAVPSSNGNFELAIRWDFPPSPPIQIPGFP